MNTHTLANKSFWRRLCKKSDLVVNSGVVALSDDVQIALFYVADEQRIYALENRDPLSGANVIGRGIIGNLAGEPVIASPLYKQHFRLTDGACLEDERLRLRVWPARLSGDAVEVKLDAASSGVRSTLLPMEALSCPI